MAQRSRPGGTGSQIQADNVFDAWTSCSHWVNSLPRSFTPPIVTDDEDLVESVATTPVPVPSLRPSPCVANDDCTPNQSISVQKTSVLMHSTIKRVHFDEKPHRHSRHPSSEVQKPPQRSILKRPNLKSHRYVNNSDNFVGKKMRRSDNDPVNHADVQQLQKPPANSCTLSKVNGKFSNSAVYINQATSPINMPQSQQRRSSIDSPIQTQSHQKLVKSNPATKNQTINLVLNF